MGQANTASSTQQSSPQKVFFNPTGIDKLNSLTPSYKGARMSRGDGKADYTLLSLTCLSLFTSEI